MENLLLKSKEIILNNQSSSGAYIASPNFSTYHYSWLRDGSFIAYSMDVNGEHDSAYNFFRWVDNVIRKHAWKIDLIQAKVKKGLTLQESDLLHARYTLLGEESKDEWTNIQFDGYGTWLWALSEHVEITNNPSLIKDFAFSIEKTVQYLISVWQYPNYDLWEENSEYIHPYTLSAIYSGLESAIKMADLSSDVDLTYMPSDILGSIREFTLEYGVAGGHLIKSFSPPGKEQEESINYNNGVDASLVGAAIPYHMFDPTDSIILSSVAQIEEKLHRPQGGVYRFQTDTFYGGGEWLLLAAWLGWYYAEIGEYDLAKKLRRWIEDQSDAEGHLPEQVSSNTLSPDYIKEWEDRWGPVAKPLLWSHAMYLILHDALEERP